MTTTTDNDSGLNLDHLEALARAAQVATGKAHPDEHDPEYDFTAAANPAAVRELIALARRAAPVLAPIAGDALPPLPKPAAEQKPEYDLPGVLYFTARQMQNYARAALANQPAPTAAPEQVAQGVDERALFEAWTDKEDSPVWVSDIERHQEGYVRVSTDMAWEAWKARAALAQPPEAAPLGEIVAANRDAARYRYLATLMDWSDIERACWSTPAKSAAEFKRGLDKYIDSKLADISPDHAQCIAQIDRAAPAPTVPSGDEKALFAAAFREYDRRADDGIVGLRWNRAEGHMWRAARALAHQPAQEQASPAHETIVSQAGALVCTACGTTAQAAQHEAGDELAQFENYFCMTLSCDDSEPAELVEAARAAACDAWMERARRAAASPVVRAQSEESAPSLLNADELAALRRFDETCQDGEGYDVPKPMMQRLTEIGVVRRRYGAYYQVTQYGLAVLSASTQQACTGLDAKDAERYRALRDAKKIPAQVWHALESGEDVDGAVDLLIALRSPIPFCEPCKAGRYSECEQVFPCTLPVSDKGDAAIRAAQEGEQP